MKLFLEKVKKSNKIMLAIFLIIFLAYFVSLGFLTKALLSLVGIETFIRTLVLIIFYSMGIIYTFVSFSLLFKKRKKSFIGISLFIVLMVPIFSLGHYFINTAYSSIKGMSKNTLIYTSNLIALNETDFSRTNSSVGMINDKEDIEGYILANKLIKQEKLKNKINYYDDYYEMLADLYDGTIDAIYVSSNYAIMFSNVETFENIENEVRVIFEYSEEMKNKDNVSTTAKKLTEPFTVLILGVDSENEGMKASQAFNGDTLMLLSFNPKTLSAVIFSIPRDTYVPIACRNNEMAKINSSSSRGTKCVVDTIKQLTDIDIDYYVKINFKGVVDLVEALGGIDVTVPKAFCEQNSKRNWGKDTICLEEGYQHVNGEEALAFARHRKTLPRGDIDRIQNQQHIIEQIGNKAKTIRSFEDFKKILTAVENNIDTNMSTNQILSFYNVGKSILLDSLKNEEFIQFERTYLEYYDLPIYIPKLGNYTSALGYYTESLKAITKAFKVNLELEKPELIKTFSYSYGENYEIKPIGKDLRNGSRIETVPSFIGKSKSEIDAWCNSRGITAKYENINSGNSMYNPAYPTGYIIGQSVHQGTLVKSVSSITFYVMNNTSGTTNNNNNNQNQNNNQNNNNNSGEDCDPDTNIDCTIPGLDTEDEE